MGKSNLTTLCYIEKEDSYLMMHRISKKNDVNKDKWIGVGGHFEQNESPEECLLREVYEETGLRLNTWRFRGLITFISDDAPAEYMHLYTSDGFEGSVTETDGSMKQCNEGVLAWVSKDQIGRLNLWEGDRIFLELLRAEHPFFSLKLRYEGDRLAEAVLDGKTIAGNAENVVTSPEMTKDAEVNRTGKNIRCRHSQITEWVHEILLSQAKRGGVYIDATMGKGNDTLFLCQMAESTGKVYAFDIQEEALEKTRQLLKKHRAEERAELILDGHEHMDRYLRENSADVICFNFGYLPEGDHKIATKVKTSVEAVKKGLDILKPDGVMSLCIYSGGDTGFEEKEALLSFLKTLPAKEYTVIRNDYWNRENDPPMPVFVFKI